MSIFNKIALLFFSVVFLLSSTGLFLIFHECQSCEISEIYINTGKHEHKQMHEHENHQSSDKTCCYGSVCEINSEKDTDCCSDDTYYLKISEPYTFSFIKIKFQKVCLEIFNFFDYKEKVQKHSVDTSTQIIKPPDLFGIDLLHNICILRI